MFMSSLVGEQQTPVGMFSEKIVYPAENITVGVLPPDPLSVVECE